MRTTETDNWRPPQVLGLNDAEWREPLIPLDPTDWETQHWHRIECAQHERGQAARVSVCWAILDVAPPFPLDNEPPLV